ncbi:MAG: cation diffusion facilitator family transporter [Bacilli bacterium]|nr:cation diffusion facilitator family transporter [Bacilli bacterium]MDD4077036.1 cation diffusion facilitator family transporter [Bacilli bacterium]MDD4387642.1 cation diffusion facilitator family transporter [Bacilli bacterium]
MNRYQKINRLLILILVINFIVAAVKIAMGYLFKINSLTSDGIHALSDGTSNIVGLIGTKYAARNPDKEHPYGYYKYETAAAFVIGFMLFAITLGIIANVVLWFLSPKIPAIDALGFLGIIFTLILNTIIATLEYRAGKRLESEVLVTDSLHTRCDIFISAGVLFSILLIKFGFPYIIDPILSLFIAGLIFISCVKIFRSTLHVLLDKKAVDEQAIIDIVSRVDSDILDVHKIRSRGKKNHIYIDLHFITYGDKTVFESHDLSHRIEEELKLKLQKNIDIIAHIEPYEEKAAL